MRQRRVALTGWYSWWEKQFRCRLACFYVSKHLGYEEYFLGKKCLSIYGFFDGQTDLIYLSVLRVRRVLLEATSVAQIAVSYSYLHPFQ
jgi:hypothetical protein